MSPSAAELVRADQKHLIDPLHHPVDNANTVICVRGRGVIIQDIEGHDRLVSVACDAVKVVLAA